VRCLGLRLLVCSVVLLGCTTAERGERPGSAAGDAARDAAVDALALVDELPAGRLRLAMVRPASFRPDEVVLSDQAGVIVADLLYDGLTEARAGDAVLAPALASEWWADDDFRRWTFRLDPQAAVDAEDVVSGLATLVRTPVAQAGGAGRPMVALTAGMRSVTAVGDTVVVELERSNAGLPWVLSGLPFSAVGDDGRATGDYEIAFRDDSGMVLRRRVGRAAMGAVYGAIELTWVEDRAEAHRLLVDGVVDGAVVEPSSVAGASLATGVTPLPTSTVRYYVLNHEAPALSTAEQRLALLEVVDRDRVLAGLGRIGLQLSDGLASPSSAGYRSGACGAPCRPPDAVRSEDGPLGPAGTEASGVGPSWPTGALEVAFAGVDQQSMAGALADELAAVGIGADTRQVTARELAEAIVEGTTDLFTFGWVAPAGSVDAILPPLLRADSPANVARVGSPEVEVLLDRAALTGDDEERWRLLDLAHRETLAEAKILPVAVSTSSLLLGPEVVGVRVRVDGSIDLESAR
jgi:ABC-type transport system substrate-binding protein